MRIIINGRKLPLTDAIKQHINDKLSRLDAHYDFLKEIHVFLSVEKNPRIHDSHIVEATIHVNGGILRVKASSEHLYASVDLLVDKIERSLRRHKTKQLQRAKSGHSAGGNSIRHIGDLEDRLADVTPDETDEEHEFYAVEGVQVETEEELTASA